MNRTPRRIHLAGRLLVTTLVLLTVLAGTVRQAAAQTVTDVAFGSDQFPLTLSWDAPWEVTEDSVSSEEGFERIQFTGERGVLEVILVSGGGDPGAVLDVLVDNVSDRKDFEEIGRGEGEGFVSATVGYSVELDSGLEPVRQYFEVSDVSGGSEFTNDGLFTASLLALTDDIGGSYDSVQDVFIRNGDSKVFLGAPEGFEAEPAPAKKTPKTQSEPSGEGIDGNTYVAPTYGFGVVWDEDEFSASEESAKGDDLLVLESEISRIEILGTEGATDDVGDCVSERAKLVKAGDGVSGFTRLTRRYTMPDLERDAFARLYGYTVENEDGETSDLVAYVECRHLSEGNDLLMLVFFTNDADYEDELVKFLEVVDSIDLEGKTTAATPKKTPTEEAVEKPEEEETPSIAGKIGKADETPEVKSTPKPKATEEPSSDLPGVKGTTYTSPAYGFKIRFGSDWEATEASSNDNGDSLSLTNGTSLVLVLSGNFSDDASVCQQQAVDLLASGEGVTNFKPVNGDDDQPIFTETDSATFGLYSFSEGDADSFVYIQCQVSPGGDFNVVFVQQIPVESFADEVAGMNELANAIEFP